MHRSTFIRFSRLAGFCGALLLAAPEAFAQIRGPYYPPYPYGYRMAEPESNVRIKVEPRDADVYVDGYFAGKVDDFDGTFQRLHVTPGQHEIVVYLGGYRPLREKLYLSSNSTRTIEGTLQKLGPDEPPEPPPVPEGEPQPPQMPPIRGGMPPRAPFPPGRMPGDAARSQRGAAATLALRVQPQDAEVRIDGQSWENAGDATLEVQVGAGRHHIVVRKAGYEPFETEVVVRPGETLPVNIGLTPER